MRHSSELPQPFRNCAKKTRFPAQAALQDSPSAAVVFPLPFPV